MESQVSCHDNPPENVFITSETHHIASNQPAKKQTRKWAAWTRQEQESFFNALRQVGKNFDKITSRVQSKNKDQVRHYYYRVVRRMNKLLGPRLSLDAKNSKHTNAAMLQWWSLLEKHSSCKPSKLHLNPQRFNIFLETLEHQLLKDQKKNTTKLKLQLFPINESIRKALETDNHNPHLELTLSFRKKISSVLQHMNCKWGSCSIASGELTLVPYNTHILNLINSQKWTQHSVVTAGDVYSAVGNPPVFRLRYGWFVAPQEPPVPPGSQCPFSCDSFDAAIAAHISKNLGNNAVVSSVLDAEETCDAFTFFKKEDTGTAIEKPPEEPVEDCPEKDVNALTDIYWPDSLGGLEVGVGACRYQSNELILSECLGGLSRILTSSLDAFHNSSFFAS